MLLVLQRTILIIFLLLLPLLLLLLPLLLLLLLLAARVVMAVVVLHGIDKKGHKLLRVQGHLGGHNHLPAVTEAVVRHLAHGTLCTPFGVKGG
jgi:hypothetical protein